VLAADAHEGHFCASWKPSRCGTLHCARAHPWAPQGKSALQTLSSTGCAGWAVRAAGGWLQWAPTARSPLQGTHHKDPTMGTPLQGTHHKDPTMGTPLQGTQPQRSHHEEPTARSLSQRSHCSVLAVLGGSLGGAGTARSAQPEHLHGCGLT